MSANHEKQSLHESSKAKERTLLQRIEKALEDSKITSDEAKDIQTRMLNDKNIINKKTYTEWYDLNKDMRRQFQKAIDTKADAVLGRDTKAKLIERASGTTESKSTTPVANNAPESKPTEDARVVQGMQASTEVLKTETPAVAEVEVKEEVKETSKRVKIAPSEDLSVKFEKDEKGEVKLDSMMLLLADLDGNGVVESKNRGLFRRVFFGGGEQMYPFGEQQTLGDMREFITSKEDLNALAGRLGVVLPWNTELDEISIKRDSGIEGFKKALIKEVSILSDISALILGDNKARAGLVSVLTGRSTELQNELLKNKESLKKIQDYVKNDPNVLETVGAILAKIGILLPVAILSKGLIVGFVEARDVDMNGEKGGLMAKKNIGENGSVAASINAIGAKVEGNLNDPSSRVANRTKLFLDAFKDAENNIILPESSKIMEEVQKVVKTAEGEVADEKVFSGLCAEYVERQKRILDAFSRNNLTKESQTDLIDRLVHNTFVFYARVEELKGFNFKGIFGAVSLSGTAIGLTGSEISVTSSMKEGAKLNASTAEAEVNKKKLSPAKKMELLNNEKYTYVVNPDGTETLTMEYDGGALTPDLKRLEESCDLKIENGKIVIRTRGTSEVLSIMPVQVSLPDGAKIIDYKFSLIETSKPNQATGVESSVGSVRQAPATVKNAIEGRKKIKVGEGIYEMAREKEKFPNFDKALILIGNQEYVEAYKMLKTMEKHSKVVAAILKEVGTDYTKLATVNTFTYGGVERNAKTISSKQYSLERKKTISAEDRLMRKVTGNKNYVSDQAIENEFKAVKMHSPKQLKDIYSGQGMAVSVLATPKGGTHRVDKYDGSITVSDHTAEIRNETDKKFLIKEHKRTTERLVEALNAYLSPLKIEISQEEYENMLLTGELPQTFKDNKITFQSGKTPKFIQARAMVTDGNICVNKTEAIIYPLFERPGVAPQLPAPVPVVDMIWYGSVVLDRDVSMMSAGLGAGKKFEKAEAARGTQTNPDLANGPTPGSTGTQLDQ